jgi:hypothetical protein
MISKYLAVSGAVAAISLAAPAAAQTFTFQSEGKPSTTITIPGPEGKPYGAAAFNGSGSTTWADGKKTTYTYTCISMSQPPNNSIFQSHMMCDVVAPDGTFAATFGCNAMAADEMGCVGGLTGKSGAYANKRGGLTSYGKGMKSWGTGQWN